MGDTLDLAALSRATLARQLLSKREKLDVTTAVERVFGMQAQLARAPYVGLWSRVAKLERGDLDRAFEKKLVVRSTLMRGTLHLTSAADYVSVRGTIQIALDHVLRGILRDRMKDTPVDDVVKKARAFFATPRTMDELRDGGVFQGDIRAQAYAARLLGPLVQMSDGSTRFVLAEKWLGKKVPMKTDAELLVRRYLAAYGPATIADAQTWSGIPNLKDAFAALKKELVVFRDEKKRELFDLPRAPRPSEDEPSPPRFLPEFGSILLAHKDRRRFIADPHRKAVYLPALRVAATILVGGVVAGTWDVENKKGTATLTVRPFAKLARADQKTLEGEADALVRFVEPDAKGHVIRWAT